MALLDGKALAQIIREEIKVEVDQLISRGERPPHLAAVLVGEDPASQVYVRNKVRSCEKVGFQSTLVRRAGDISQEALLNIVRDLNQDETVDGFIVQLPLPSQLNEEEVTLAISPKKDVDGFHPENFGRMAQGMPAYLSATPAGMLEMLKRYEISTSGKEVVVVGRSNIVGRPISILLSRKDPFGNATVTLCHSRTQNLEEHLKRADIVVAAIGRPEFITGAMVKEGVVVLDVGINRVDDPDHPKGYRLVGDVQFDSVSEKASFITPVPGGVGQMTVVSLLLNTLKARKGEVFG